jgi:hypothetical protein
MLRCGTRQLSVIHMRATVSFTLHLRPVSPKLGAPALRRFVRPTTSLPLPKSPKPVTDHQYYIAADRLLAKAYRSPNSRKTNKQPRQGHWQWQNGHDYKGISNKADSYSCLQWGGASAPTGSRRAFTQWPPRRSFQRLALSSLFARTHGRFPLPARYRWNCHSLGIECNIELRAVQYTRHDPSRT